MCVHLQRLPAAPLSLHVVLLVGSVIVATANTLSDRETCLSANEVDVCAHASASFGDTLPLYCSRGKLFRRIDSARRRRKRAGHLKVNDVVVAATNETCSAVVSQEWHDLVDTTRTWGQLLVVTFVIQAVVLLWVGCLSPSSKPGGGTEACMFLGVIFATPIVVVYLVKSPVRNLPRTTSWRSKCGVGCDSSAACMLHVIACRAQVILLGDYSTLESACGNSQDFASIGTLIVVGYVQFGWQCCASAGAVATGHNLSRSEALKQTSSGQP